MLIEAGCKNLLCIGGVFNNAMPADDRTKGFEKICVREGVNYCIGFDDVILASLTSPQISTIHQPISEMSEIAVDLLVKAADGNVVPRRTILPVEYVKRETT